MEILASKDFTVAKKSYLQSGLGLDQEFNAYESELAKHGIVSLKLLDPHTI